MPVTADRAQEHLKRHDALLEQTQNHRLDWEDIRELLLPGASDIVNRRMPGTSRTERVFDTTGIQAVHTLAANIQGAVTNPAIEWERLKFRERPLNDVAEVKSWLQVVNETLMLAYGSSNFYQAAHTYYLNLASFGTAAMFVGSRQVFRAPDDQSVHLRFKTLSTGSYQIAENGDGIVDTLYRTLYYTPRQAAQVWGEHALSNDLRKKLADAAKKDEYVTFLDCTYPREDYTRGRMGNKQMPFVQVVLEREQKHVVHESGYNEFPYMVARWETLDNTPWGFGPGHLALPEVRVINKLKELNLTQLVLWVQPPLGMVGQEGVIGGVSLDPGMINVLQHEKSLFPLNLTGRPDLVQINMEDVKKAIHDIFYVDQLQGLPEPDASKMTAFEVARRVEQMQRLMGPAFHRLLSEMLDPLADRVFGLLLRAGAFPQLPFSVQRAARMNQGRLDVEYTGPLARSQRGGDIRSIADVYGVANQIVGVTQDLTILDTLNHDAMLRHTAEATGLPPHLIRDAYEVLQMREARQQAQQQQQMAVDMREDMGAVGKVAPAIQAFQQMQEAA